MRTSRAALATLRGILRTLSVSAVGRTVRAAGSLTWITRLLTVVASALVVSARHADHLERDLAAAANLLRPSAEEA
jgi:hypothetical protein